MSWSCTVREKLNFKIVDQWPHFALFWTRERFFNCIGYKIFSISLSLNRFPESLVFVPPVVVHRTTVDQSFVRGRAWTVHKLKQTHEEREREKKKRGRDGNLPLLLTTTSLYQNTPPAPPAHNCCGPGKLVSLPPVQAHTLRGTPRPFGERGPCMALKTGCLRWAFCTALVFLCAPCPVLRQFWSFQTRRFLGWTWPTLSVGTTLTRLDKMFWNDILPAKESTRTSTYVCRSYDVAKFKQKCW